LAGSLFWGGEDWRANIKHTEHIFNVILAIPELLVNLHILSLSVLMTAAKGRNVVELLVQLLALQNADVVNGL
jgi:hypothetical protein